MNREKLEVHGRRIRGRVLVLWGCFLACVYPSHALFAQGTSCDDAPLVEIGTEITRELAVPDERDFFRIETPSFGRLTVSTRGDTDTTGRLIDISGGTPVTIVERLSGGAGRNFLISEELSAGLYCVEVRGGGQDNTGSYIFRVEGDFIIPAGSCGGLETTIVGTVEDDIIRGTEGDDVIAVFAGNDIVYGLGGNDVICGGNGDDILIGGDGNDRLFGDDGNDILRGDDGNDRLTGGDGINILLGGSGDNDIMNNNSFLGDTTQDNSITPADALCVFRRFLDQPSCLQ